MDIDKLDNYLIGQIKTINDCCEVVVTAINQNRIDVDTALILLNTFKSTAITTYNQRCEIFKNNGLDYSSIEESKNELLEAIDSDINKYLSKSSQTNNR